MSFVSGGLFPPGPKTLRFKRRDEYIDILFARKSRAEHAERTLYQGSCGESCVEDDKLL